MAKNLALGPNLGQKIFFHGFYLYYMLDIMYAILRKINEPNLRKW